MNREDHMNTRENTKSHVTCWSDRMGMGSEPGEWGNGEEPNRPNEGDALFKTLNM